MLAEQQSSVYDEVLEFLISAPTPEQIIAFRPPEATQARLRYLLDTNRAGTLTAEEQMELDEYSRVEHFVRMLKIKAHEKLIAA